MRNLHAKTKKPLRLRLITLLATLMAVAGSLAGAVPVVLTAAAIPGSIKMDTTDKTSNSYVAGQTVNVKVVDSDASVGRTVTYDLGAANLTTTTDTLKAGLTAFDSSVTALDNAKFTMTQSGSKVTVAYKTSGTVSYAIRATAGHFAQSTSSNKSTLTASVGGVTAGSLSLSEAYSMANPTRSADGYRFIPRSVGNDVDGAPYTLSEFPLFYYTRGWLDGTMQYATLYDNASSNSTSLLKYAMGLGSLSGGGVTAGNGAVPAGFFTDYYTNVAGVPTLVPTLSGMIPFQSSTLISYKTPVGGTIGNTGSYARLNTSLFSKNYYMPNTPTLPTISLDGLGMPLWNNTKSSANKGLQQYTVVGKTLYLKLYQVKSLNVIDSVKNTSVANVDAEFADMQAKTTAGGDAEIQPKGYTTGSAFYWGVGTGDGNQPLSSLSFTNSDQYYLPGGKFTIGLDSTTGKITSTAPAGVTKTVAAKADSRLETLNVYVTPLSSLTDAQKTMQIKAVNTATPTEVVPGEQFTLKELNNTTDAVAGGDQTTATSTGLASWSVPNTLLGTQTRYVSFKATAPSGWAAPTKTYYAKWELGKGFTGVNTVGATGSFDTTVDSVSIDNGQLVVGNTKQAAVKTYTIETDFSAKMPTAPTSSVTNLPGIPTYAYGSLKHLTGVAVNLLGMGATSTGKTLRVPAQADGILDVTDAQIASLFGTTANTIAAGTTYDVRVTLDATNAKYATPADAAEASISGFTNPLPRTVKFTFGGSNDGFSTYMAETNTDAYKINDHTYLDAANRSNVSVAKGGLAVILRRDTIVVQGHTLDDKIVGLLGAQLQLTFYSDAARTKAIGQALVASDTENGEIVLPDPDTLLGGKGIIVPNTQLYVRLSEPTPFAGYSSLAEPIDFDYNQFFGYQMASGFDPSKTKVEQGDGSQVLLTYSNTDGSVTNNSQMYVSSTTTITLQQELQTVPTLTTHPTDLNFGQTVMVPYAQRQALKTGATKLAGWNGTTPPTVLATNLPTDLSAASGSGVLAATVEAPTAGGWRLSVTGNTMKPEATSGDLTGADISLGAVTTYLGDATSAGAKVAGLSGTANQTVPLDGTKQTLVENLAGASGTYRMLWDAKNVFLNLPANAGASDGDNYAADMTWQVEVAP
ncbi:WxL domain-containing protein [Lacticaseibacillus parakribbianus]|uniref:WxL domain-containing protein n=1 Tax=Lacticaseibacillus parakribbianus TaxID=2970927 RepID=UPI0021CB624F|nr:WxL domain-containing protein [Lacticaseibacillus parakribbianus]